MTTTPAEPRALSAAESDQCGWVCPIGRQAHPAKSTHYWTPPGDCRCGHAGTQHPDDGGCTSLRGCDCDGFTTEVRTAAEADAAALRAALKRALLQWETYADGQRSGDPDDPYLADGDDVEAVLYREARAALTPPAAAPEAKP
jgi:hypothetical protein